MGYETDVDKYVNELSSQLVQESLDPAGNIMKTLHRLTKALQSDGFSITLNPVVVNKSMTTSGDFVLQAFRVSSSSDAAIVDSIFSGIEGWRAKILEFKGRHYVVVSNAPRLTKKRVKTALASLLNTNSVQA